MSDARNAVLVADVGNTRLKLAVVEAAGPAGGMPAVARRQDLLSRDFRPANLERWLAAAAPGPAVLLVAAVNEAAATRLEAAVAEISATRHRPIRQRRLVHAHLPVAVRVDAPDRVGIDRVCAAAAAVAARPGRPVVVVDCGTATTVDLVSPAGEFLGGAILPGPTLLARALAEGTSRLPEVAALDTAPPPALPGRSTQSAIAAGIGWGMRGAVARLVVEARAALGGAADVILTGGSAGVVRDAIPDAVEMPDLVLAGIALAAPRLLGPDRDPR
ncbi:MAG: type III pantothenate kinase [Planctomycetaceae bacterium]